MSLQSLGAGVPCLEAATGSNHERLGTVIVMLAIISALAGGFLGVRFRALILLPSTLVVLILALVMGIAAARSFSSTASAAILVMAGLQLGYLGGALSSFFIASRMRRRRAALGSAHPLPTEPDARA
jgi:hypothetical protein